MANKKTILSVTLKKVMEAYKKDLALIGTEKLRAYTAEAGLKPQVASSLLVSARTDQKNLVVEYPAENRNDVLDFAYATEKGPATPVIQDYLRGVI